jgi:hypothetical protein
MKDERQDDTRESVAVIRHVTDVTAAESVTLANFDTIRYGCSDSRTLDDVAAGRASNLGTAGKEYEEEGLHTLPTAKSEARGFVEEFCIFDDTEDDDADSEADDTEAAAPDTEVLRTEGSGCEGECDPDGAQAATRTEGRLSQPSGSAQPSSSKFGGAKDTQDRPKQGSSHLVATPPRERGHEGQSVPAKAAQGTHEGERKETKEEAVQQGTKARGQAVPEFPLVALLNFQEIRKTAPAPHTVAEKTVVEVPQDNTIE